jgi:hypothetical protein
MLWCGVIARPAPAPAAAGAGSATARGPSSPRPPLTAACRRFERAGRGGCRARYQGQGGRGAQCQATGDGGHGGLLSCAVRPGGDACFH